MVDSDNTTTLPFVIGRQRDELERPGSQATDSALRLWSEWQRTRYASLLLCRIQQRSGDRNQMPNEFSRRGLSRPASVPRRLACMTESGLSELLIVGLIPRSRRRHRAEAISRLCRIGESSPAE